MPGFCKSEIDNLKNKNNCALWYSVPENDVRFIKVWTEEYGSFPQNQHKTEHADAVRWA